ncbi:50S ribosomal protein L25/general stress protein Ctc [Acuticoccus sp. M5D2P5]|uniref:50S ribosomal protein L25/general stress protein Ctc n=1 Tax=Acuticoccus kalidii TaxID=2910977 RepID=UPI001F275835|nr:50S ribosomal protein L25/general stress protein Ctc [Acuticoccus kalidii]MCF3932273.1 50S ribosomal protein L25/general stress protein Ctc [Acuticoccus kalidii]
MSAEAERISRLSFSCLQIRRCMMADAFQLKAAVRERTGKGAARALRREGLIPAVIYGDNQPPVAIAISHKQAELRLYSGGFLTNLWNIEVGGETIQALARDYQLEPVKDFLVHVDFLRVTARSRVTVDVPVHVVGEEDSPGIKQNDGVLNLVSHTVSVNAAATRIPDSVEIDVSGLEIGATITSAQVKLPSDVHFANEEEFTVATITAPIAEEPEEVEEDAEAEAGEGAETEGESGDGDESSES